MTTSSLGLRIRHPADFGAQVNGERPRALPQLAKELLALPAAEVDAWALRPGRLEYLSELADALGNEAASGNRAAVAQLHEVLSSLYELTFVIPRNSFSSAHGSCALRVLQAFLERAATKHLAAAIPRFTVESWSSGEEFVQRLLELTRQHAAFEHPYYCQTLRHEGSLEDLRFYFAQESTVDPRFDDLVAMLQIGTQGVAKQELASNYSDEMGNGNPADVHSDLFAKALHALGLDGQASKDSLSVESRICGNLSVLLASRRENFFRAAGYFGVMEFLVPRRMEHVLYSWSRNGLPADSVRYHQLHISIDEGHSSGWFRNIVAPAVDADPECAAEIAEGVAWRLETSRWYLDMLEANARGVRS